MSIQIIPRVNRVLGIDALPGLKNSDGFTNTIGPAKKKSSQLTSFRFNAMTLTNINTFKAVPNQTKSSIRNTCIQMFSFQVKQEPDQSCLSELNAAIVSHTLLEIYRPPREWRASDSGNDR
jgi:hypothetical protein